MDTEDKADFFTDDVHETVDEPTAVTPAPVAETETQPIWARRTVLKAAALGAATAAFVNRDRFGNLNFGAPSALANDLSNKPCTAQDVKIDAVGFVLDPPCECDGTFTADVQFDVINTTGTERYCVVLHFPDGVDADDDVILRAVSGPFAGQSVALRNSTTRMVGSIPGIPCGQAEVCFGSAGVTRGKCAPGTCMTIAWSTTPSDANCSVADQSPPGGQCRHQQVCIQNRGETTLECQPASCDVPCGGDATLELCTTSDPDIFGPFTFNLVSDDPDVIITPTPPVTGAGPCQTFTAGPITGDTLFTGTVTDSSDPPCADSASTTVTTTPITLCINDVTGDEECGDGNLTIKATASGSDCTFAWSIDDVLQEVTGDTLSYPADPDSATHTVEVTATCGDCVSETESVTISQCITSTVGPFDACPAGLTKGAKAARAESRAESSARTAQKGGQKGKKGGKNGGKKGGKNGGKNGGQKGAAKKRN